MSENYPTEWELLPLEEVVGAIIDYRGKTPKKESSGIPLVTAKIVKAGKLLEASEYISEDNYDSWMKRGFPEIGDVVITTEAPLGEVAQLKSNKVALAQRIVTLRGKKGITTSDYLYCVFQGDFVQHQLEARASGSTVKGIKQSELRKVEVPIPPLHEQEFISNQIQLLNAKIDLNEKQNNVLEQISQAIFKSWFIDFEPTKVKIAAREALLAENPAATPEQIATAEQQAAIQAIAGAGDVIPTEQLQAIAELFPNQFVDSELGEIPCGWEIKALDQIANYQNGLALQKFRPESGEDFLPVLKIAQLKAGFADGKEVAKASIKKECIVDNGDVIFSWSGSLVVDIWCGGRVALNQHLFKVTSNTYPKWFFYKWTKYHLEKFQQIAADKAVTMGHIKRSHLSEAKCLIPASELIKNKIISSLIDKQVQVRLESKVLSDVRDSLLPRLLAGEFSLAKVDSEHE